MTGIDWPLIRALVREVPRSAHSQRCPCIETRAGIEQCTCWVLASAKRQAVHVEALLRRRDSEGSGRLAHVLHMRGGEGPG